MSLRAAARRQHRRRDDERGYVAILVAILLVPLLAVAALAVDVGQWYVMARETQRAADAAALGGVPYLPTDPDGAFSAARRLAGGNGFSDGLDDATVQTAIHEAPTQLRVTVSRTVRNSFGALLGMPTTRITRSSVADYAGPVPLGSPCNRYGNDPEQTAATTSAVCEDAGQFWGNVGSLKATKASGDAYQNNVCASGVSGCVTASGPNIDYDVNGYFYSVTLTKPVPQLVIQAFDPALIHVADKCDANVFQATISGKTVRAKELAGKALVGNAAQRYAEGSASPYCTGDQAFANATSGFANQVGTSYVVRDPGANAWDPASFPVRDRCEGTGTYPGYSGNLVNLLDTTSTTYASKPTGTGLAAVASEDGYVAKVFRQWRTLCTVDNAQPGTYLVQVKTNGVGFDAGNGHNRFALRAYAGTTPGDNTAIALSGYGKMTAYANLPDATTTFHLARVPSSAVGQLLNVQLFDVGDSSKPGTIQILPPQRSGLTRFTGCLGKGVRNGALTDCTLTSVSSNHNGKWQTVAVPIPASYRCDDRDPSDCWVRLQYRYGTGNQPTDTTSWAASIEGDPVRLIE